MQELSTIQDVYDALDGPSAVAAMFDLTPSAATNWRAEGLMPLYTKSDIQAALAKKGKTADASLWRTRRKKPVRRASAEAPREMEAR